MFKRILVAVDLAEPDLSKEALAKAASLRDASEGEVRVIYVASALIDAVSRYLPKNFIEDEARKARETLLSLAAAAGIPADAASAISSPGNAYEAILKEAKSFGADLIVIGSHRPAVSTYLLGSNAAKVVRHATCSVLVIR